ncbi:MAG: glycosyltransferase family 4 protein [Blastocatellia bacterium]|nr:glycosyltransferase family 4 protein [Blastocatellia bacterium]MCS7158304.1 glycosyltransferase family 4 protein [Blastocatellia bacterium]MCX7753142.1 glycosyltransferase family 4 protein [Blastocatellia bacterium]MDW8169457.1 glycosyltransferase family 4 protein [Acidobacteriota bacterium]MDW8255731.1 glycosyltransferase family 4 protein [Acidobacteriota bacterium]
MKIALVVHRFFPEGIGGVETLTAHLARALRERGHGVLLLCAARSLGFEGPLRFLRETYGEIPIWRIAGEGEKKTAPIRATYRDEAIGEAVAQLWREERPDLVHVLHGLFLSASVIESAHRAGLPLVWTLPDYWPICWKTTLLTWDDRLCAGDWRVPTSECVACLIFESRTYRRLFGENRFWPRPLARGLVRIARSAVGHRVLPPLWTHAVEALRARPEWFRTLVRHADALVAVSSFSFDLFRAIGFPQDRLRLIEQTIVPVVGAMPASARKERWRFGYIGRMTRTKGVDVLVRAFRLADLGGRATLELFGGFEDAAFRDRVLQLADGDPRIRFHGEFPPERLGEVLAQIDVLVIPSRWPETGPLVLLEALAAGRPVLGARVGQMGRMIEPGRNGWFFERGDAHDLAAALRKIVARSEAWPDLRYASHSIKPFEEMVSEYEALYRECVERHGREASSAHVGNPDIPR